MNLSDLFYISNKRRREKYVKFENKDANNQKISVNPFKKFFNLILANFFFFSLNLKKEK